MTDDDVLAEFTAVRGRLLGIAYGILGDRGEAEDVVQDAWLRLARTTEPIESVVGLAVVTVSRLALDAVGSARRRRESYVGPWLPEPVLDGETTADPADRVAMADQVSMAMLVVLETLSPAERTAFVLHDVFGLSFAEIADVVGRTPVAVRQLASRARRRVRDGTPRFDADAARHRRVAEAFAAAAHGGDVQTLLSLLDPDVVLLSDGGGVVSAARNPIVGADRVARMLAGIARRTPGRRWWLRSVNGAPGAILTEGNTVVGVASVSIVDGRVLAVHVVLNPAKLVRVAASLTHVPVPSPTSQESPCTTD